MHGATPCRLAVASVAILIALALGSAAAAAPMTAKEFVARGNASCRAYESALTKIPTFDDLPGAARFFAQAHPHAQRFLRELRQLTPPPGQAPTLARMIRLVEQSNRLDVPLVLAARRGDGTTFARHLAAMSDLEAPIRTAARRLSLTACLWD